MQHRLFHLLESAFSPETFHAFLLGVEGGRAIAHELPSVDTSPQRYFVRATEVLAQHGLVRGELFETLVRHRPHRRAEIAEVAAAIGVTLPGPDVSLRAPTVTPAPADRLPILEPTLGRWCGEQWRSLALLCGAPVAVAALVAALPTPADAALTRVNLALYVGQAVFAGSVLLCLATWPTPDASRLFGASRTYRRLWRQLAELEGGASPGAPAVRAAAGADPHTPETLARWLDAAIEAREQTRRAWLLLWSAWMTLYVVAIAFGLTPSPAPHTVALLRALLTLLNNASTAAIFIGFWVLTYITVPLIPTRRDIARPGGPAVGLTATAIVVLYGVVQAVTVLGRVDPAVPAAAQQAAVHAASSWFDFGSGMSAAIVIAMFIGRLDSPFIEPGRAVLVALYLYAAIQPTWSVLSLVTGNTTGSSSTEAVVFAVAWAAKIVLFALFAWMLHTGRLDFHLLRVRRLQASVASDWRALTG